MVEDWGSLKWAFGPGLPAASAAAGNMGATAFDFDGDGIAEIVFADYAALRALRGSDGTLLFELPLAATAQQQAPVVADVDGDGRAEIVAVASSLSSPAQGGVLVYGGAGGWLPTRPIWNQHSYHVTNVEDDGAIPSPEPRSWDYPNSYRENRLTYGALFAAADVTASYLRRAATSASVTLTARVGNAGAAPTPAALPVSFYDGDPAANGVLLGTASTTASIGPGQFQDVTLTLPANAGSDATVWVVADDLGGYQGTLAECDEINNRFDSGLYLNRPPTVSAGADQTISMPAATATLSGSVSDDGLPVGAQVSVSWSMVSGPGSVTFANPGAASTSA